MGIKRLYNIPLLQSIINSLILGLILGGIGYLKTPSLKFHQPSITYNKCLIYVENKTKSYNFVRINLEFEKEIECTANAIKLDISGSKKELKISRQEGRIIFWDCYKTPYLGDLKINLSAHEKVKIQLIFEDKLAHIPIKDITVFFLEYKGHFSLRDYQFYLKLRKGLIVFCIIIFLLIIPYSKFLELRQKRFLRKCNNEEEKPLHKFAEKYYKIITEEIDDYAKYLEKSEKKHFLVIIVKEHILSKWRELPKFYKSLINTIRKSARRFCIGYFLQLLD